MTEKYKRVQVIRDMIDLSDKAKGITIPKGSKAEIVRFLGDIFREPVHVLKTQQKTK